MEAKIKQNKIGMRTYPIYAILFLSAIRNTHPRHSSNTTQHNCMKNEKNERYINNDYLIVTSERQRFRFNCICHEEIN